MKAIVHREFGSPDVLRYEEVEAPVAGAGEVVIRVRAASGNPLDWKLMKGKPRFLRVLSKRNPGGFMIPGRDVAGVVESAGAGVTHLGRGVEVFGACHGAFAELARAPVRALAVKPAGVSFEQAASIPIAGVSALQAVRDQGRLQPGQKILVNGASGGVGSFAVQIARWIGGSITGVCSTRNVELVQSLGADRVVDYTQQDFTHSERDYDLVVDCVGNRSLSECRRVLRPGGRCILVGASDSLGVLGILGRILGALCLSPFSSRKIAVFIAKLNPEDLALLADLMANGKIRAVIDRTYPLAEAPEALRYLQTEHARGKVVVTLS
ncbi:MAG TPA: NAD(P)-dependent alcohol dehydrogenase [Candidatus Polarisedimenticolia bacterium]|nr:NAD(P)-dependent alcohol dehydrogenase [Candidatus Polarisedimenticolia bacterium]